MKKIYASRIIYFSVALRALISFLHFPQFPSSSLRSDGDHCGLNTIALRALKMHYKAYLEPEGRLFLAHSDPVRAERGRGELWEMQERS